MEKRGIVLVLSLIVIAIILILTGVYFSSLLTEKRSTDNERYLLQALGLAEAGADHGQSELRKRIRIDLKNTLEATSYNVVRQDLRRYFNNQDTLGLLQDYAQFSVVGNEATINLSPLDLNTAVEGNYTAKVIVKPNGVPTNPEPDVYVFPYNYRLEAVGSITRTTPAIQRQIKLGNGSFTVTVRKDSFAKFALFTNHHRLPSGPIVWFTANTNFTGPVHTNERFSFANNPSAHFTKKVTQHKEKACFYNNGWPILLDADYNGTKDVPIFDQGFIRKYDLINLESSLSQEDLKLQAWGGTGEPGENGIYLPNDGTNLIGGIYVKGNQGSHIDDVTITMSVGTDGPVYTISRDGSPTTITVDYVNNRTTVDPGGTYQGIPDGIGNEGIIIYVNDDIKSFSGTTQKKTKVTVSSERDIVITNHVWYQEYIPSPLSAEGYDNLLGILSWGGNVRIGTSAPNDINIHGVVMALHGVFIVDNYASGPPRGTATLLGGAITDFYGAFGTFSGSQQMTGYGRNFVYDARMLQGQTPPYFPFMSNFTSFDDGGLDKILTWQEGG